MVLGLWSLDQQSRVSVALILNRSRFLRLPCPKTKDGQKLVNISVGFEALGCVDCACGCASGAGVGEARTFERAGASEFAAMYSSGGGFSSLRSFALQSQATSGVLAVWDVDVFCEGGKFLGHV